MAAIGETVSKQAIIAEVWAQALVEAGQAEDAAEFYRTKKVPVPLGDGTLSRITTAWIHAKAWLLGITEQNIKRLQGSVEANKRLLGFCNDEQKALGKTVTKTATGRRNSVDYTQIIGNLERFIAEAAEKKGVILMLPESPFDAIQLNS